MHFVVLCMHIETDTIRTRKVSGYLWELICVGEVEERLEDRLAHILYVHIALLPFPHWGI